MVGACKCCHFHGIFHFWKVMLPSMTSGLFLFLTVCLVAEKVRVRKLDRKKFEFFFFVVALGEYLILAKTLQHLESLLVFWIFCFYDFEV